MQTGQDQLPQAEPTVTITQQRIEQAPIIKGPPVVSPLLQEAVRSINVIQVEQQTPQATVAIGIPAQPLPTVPVVPKLARPPTVPTVPTTTLKPMGLTQARKPAAMMPTMPKIGKPPAKPTPKPTATLMTIAQALPTQVQETKAEIIDPTAFLELQ